MIIFLDGPHYILSVNVFVLLIPLSVCMSILSVCMCVGASLQQRKSVDVTPQISFLIRFTKKPVPCVSGEIKTARDESCHELLDVCHRSLCSPPL